MPQTRKQDQKSTIGRRELPHGLRAVKGVRLYESVLEALRTFVEEGHVKPGQAFPGQRTIERQLHVSRPVLREAFRILESYGVVQTRAGGGRFLVHSRFSDVDTFRRNKLANSEQTLRALWDAREAVECRAAELAAVNRTESQLRAIERPIAMIGKVSSEEYREADFNLEFHLAIAEASGNRFLKNIINGLIVDFRKLDFKHLLPAAQWDDLQGVHQATYDAIRDRDPTRAAIATRDHFAELRNSLVIARTASGSRQASRGSRRKTSPG
jgi:GntR family transcriptional repressor for pyruvate dehydrogenase complex